MSHGQVCNPLLHVVVVVVVRCPRCSLQSKALLAYQREGFFPRLPCVLQAVVPLRIKRWCTCHHAFMTDRSSTTISGQVAMVRSDCKTRLGSLICASSKRLDMLLFSTMVLVRQRGIDERSLLLVWIESERSKLSPRWRDAPRLGAFFFLLIGQTDDLGQRFSGTSIVHLLPAHLLGCTTASSAGEVGAPWALATAPTRVFVCNPAREANDEPRWSSEESRVTNNSRSRKPTA